MDAIYNTFTFAKIGVLALVLLSCSKETLESPASDIPEDIRVENDLTESPLLNLKNIDYLALGDSYTVGASVAPEDNFPSQLSRLLQNEFDAKVELSMIAASGWRTDDLLNALESRPTKPPYELVTLLIGVNNQYQGRPFSRYEAEFPRLLQHALSLAGGRKESVVVISIPDYAYTPFGQGFETSQLSKEIDRYNSYAEDIATRSGVKFINITDISRRGLDEKELVASDNLHPSALAYKAFVGRMAPEIISQLKN